MSEQLFMVFDVESVGLHGEGFAVGWTVINRRGEEVEYGLAWCPLVTAIGSEEGREWCEKNVPPLPAIANLGWPGSIRDVFWADWLRWKQDGATLWTDCGWPVEARFLLETVDDEGKPNDVLQSRQSTGPYPLHEIATARLLAGFDPTGTYDRELWEAPAHNPLSDARQSARLLIEALDKLGALK